MASFTARANVSDALFNVDIARACGSDLWGEQTGLTLAKRSAVVVGGTQGIGSGIALRLAQAGANVCIVGRNKALGDQMVLKMEDFHPKDPSDPDVGRYQFVQADLSRVEGMKAALQDVQSRGPVDYLFQCQGSPPTATYAETEDGFEKRFATMILSKFAFMKGLAEAGQLQESAVNICATGTNRTDFDPEDPMLKRDNKYGFLASAARDGAVMDALCLSLAEKYPPLRFMHLFPGVVVTNAAANNGWPFPIPQMAALAAPILSRTIGNTPESYSNIPVYCGTNPEAKEQLGTGFVNFLGQTREVSQWAANKENRDKLYQTMSNMLK